MIRVAVNLPWAARWRVLFGATLNVDFLRSASGVRVSHVDVAWTPKINLPDWKAVVWRLRRKGLVPKASQ
jgi:hypothetical protein